VRPFTVEGEPLVAGTAGGGTSVRLTSTERFQPGTLVGVGMDSLKNRWRAWGLFQGGRLPLGHMHSTPIQIALERGLPALGCFLWWFAAFLALLWQLTGREARAPDHLLAGISLGIFGATIGFLLSSLVHYNFGDSEVVMIVYFLMGLAVVIQRHQDVKRKM